MRSFVKLLLVTAGVVVAAGAMEFVRIGSKVSEAVGSVFDAFKQGMPFRRKNDK